MHRARFRRHEELAAFMACAHAKFTGRVGVCLATSGPGAIVAVLNNGDLNMVTWEQRAPAGDPKFEASQNLPAFDYAAYAESVGLLGLRVADGADVAGTWERALAADRPVVIDALTDPNVPPLPPHVSMEQATSYIMRSMLKGDVDALATLRATMKAVLA